MTYEYIHLPQDEDIGPVDRAYRLREGILDYKGREVFYLETEASAITFCDRSYALRMGNIYIKGYIVSWQKAITPNGEPISEIERIKDKAEQWEIGQLLQLRHGTLSIDFS